tara:strand:+ start:2464 stop:3561 length:1098 start_codon:yes stop_codon:yes gene_type:complete
MNPLYDIFSLKESFKLESGSVILDPEIAYETFGTLNKDGSNAILVCHALTGNSHVTQSNTNTNTGWWDDIVGPNKAINTNEYFVICSNILGSCKGSTGPTHNNPKTKKPYGLEFPIITIGDMVQIQKELIDYLGIKKLHAVVGPSMGGMQALHWAIKFPDRLEKCVVIASSASLSAQALAFGTIGRNAIISDKQFQDGAYDENNKPKRGLGIARMIGHVTYLSKESITQKFGRKLQTKESYGYNLDQEFQVESYLKHQGDKFVDRFDANAYLYLSKALSYFDLEKEYGSLHDAFKHVQARLLFMSISSDWLYSTEQSKNMVRVCMNLNKDVSFCDIESDYGHDAFLIEHEKFSPIIQSFLESNHD